MVADAGAGSAEPPGDSAISKTTADKLIEVATHLLDTGGEDAVTLRAVGHAAGLSHNAPYKHFASRNALLAGVATASFSELGTAIGAIGASRQSPARKLTEAIGLMIAFSQQHPARYRLLFNNPDTVAAGGALKRHAMETFEQLRAIIAECQAAGTLPPDVPSQALSSLIFATAHGLLAMEGTGAMAPEKGLSSVPESMDLLLGLLSPRQGA